MAVLLVTGLSSSCGAVDDALNAHSRPVASVAGRDLGTQTLGRIMAQSPMPDSVLTGRIAAQIARLWADYVTLATVYMRPDSTQSIDFTPLLEEGRYFANLAVERYRDSILNQFEDPTEDEVREYFDTRKPFTRLDLRRIVIPVPPGASEETRDSLYDAAVVLRERVAGGADFVEVARESSAEPPAQRGVVQSFQGHESIPPVADSALFNMRPGEISPVFATDEAMFIYRVEQVRQPEFDQSRQMTFDRMVDERSEERQVRTADSLLATAQRSVVEGGPAAAMRIATEADMAVDAISGNSVLVRFVDGSLTAEDLRRLFRVRPEIRDGFAVADASQIEEFLLELAADEVLVQAAQAAGFGPSDEEKRELRFAMSAQLAKVAARYDISHELVSSPDFQIDFVSESFLRGVLQAQQPVPWLAEFRYVLDPEFPARIYDRGAETAARLAEDLRRSAANAEPVFEDDPASGEEPEGHGDPASSDDPSDNGEADTEPHG